jgi:protease I
MNQRAIVLIDELYHVLEGWYPIYRLREAGLEVTLVGREAGRTVPSRDGYPATIERSAKDLTAKDFECLVIPGGYAADFLRRDPEVVRLVGDAVQSRRVVSVICHGGWLLCSAKAVQGKRLTSFLAIKDDLVNAGANWQDAPVVRDGNLVTGRGPDDLPAFMIATLEALRELKAA